MKKRFSLLMSVCLYILGISAQEANEGVDFMDNASFQEVLNKAKSENKMVFVDCYTEWCGPCKMMASKEFPQKQAGDYFNPKFVSVKIDMEKGEGPELCTRFDVHAFPTFLFMDSDGNLLHRMVGYSKIDKFIANVEEGLNGNGLVAYMKRYDNGERDMAFINEYIAELDKAYMKGKKVEVICDLVKDMSIDDLLNDTTRFEMFYDVLSSPMDRYDLSYTNPTFLMLYKHKADVAKVYGEKKTEALEQFWKVYPMTLFLHEGTDYKGVEQEKMDEYVRFMEEQGVKSSKDVIFEFELTKALLSENYENALAMLNNAGDLLEGMDAREMNWAINKLAKEVKSAEARQTLKAVTERCVAVSEKKGRNADDLKEAVKDL